MFPIAFVVPAVIVLLVALYVAVRDLRKAFLVRARGGVGPLLTTTGETFMILATIAMFVQGRPAGLVLAPAGGWILFFGGFLLVFVGQGMESRHALRR